MAPIVVGPEELVAASAAMREAVSAAVDVAATPTTVLLTGESGAGKEVLARLIHARSAVADQPLTIIPCVRFTRATAEAALAAAGSVLFDEIAALPFDSQGHLLEVLEGKKRARVMASSNRNLVELVARGALRADLYYRLDVYPIMVPPLRRRVEDLPGLSDRALTRIAAGLGRTPARLTPESLAALATCPWPGNVRELNNVLERSAIRSRGPWLELGELPGVDDGDGGNPSSPFPSALPLDLSQLERLAIGEALRRTHGNRTHAARLLNIGLRTLRQKLNGPPRAGVRDEALLEGALKEPVP